MTTAGVTGAGIANNEAGDEEDEAATTTMPDAAATTATNIDAAAVPVWVEDEDDDDDAYELDDDDDSKIPISLAEMTTASSVSSPLERLSVDLLAGRILSHLALHEIAAAALTSKFLYAASRSDALWLQLFRRRWNDASSTAADAAATGTTTTTTAAAASEDGSRFFFFFDAYRTAHANPHDLWITHWNCAYPTDGLMPGRTCISSSSSIAAAAVAATTTTTKATTTSERKRRKKAVVAGDEGDDGDDERVCFEERCPDCRDWESWEEEELLAQEVDAETSKKKKASNRRSIRPAACGSKARAMARATLLTRLRFRDKDSRSGGDRTGLGNIAGGGRPSPTTAQRAFDAAGTFHRKLRTRQYRDAGGGGVFGGSSGFLSDVLFFNLTSPIHSDGRWELRQILSEEQPRLLDGIGGLRQPVSRAAAATAAATASGDNTNHSWHIIRLTNPDFYRPIIYQFAIQRPECFVVYPSEGYIQPGCSTTVTLGVTPFGGALAYAFEGLNVSRDGLEADWSNLYTDQAHLPSAPFLVRYRFAVAPPAFWADSMTQPWRRPQVPAASAAAAAADATASSADSTKNGNKILEWRMALDFHWKQPVPPHLIKCIHLRAHVHSHYSFWKFLHDTCRPFDLTRDLGPFYCSPTLRELYPSVYVRLENVESESRSLVMWSHTEGPCKSCRKSWGLRHEELAQAYWIMRGECRWQKHRRQLLMRNIEKCLRFLCSWSNERRRQEDSDPRRLSALLYAMTCVIHALKASPWLSRRQKSVLINFEALGDRLYHSVAVGGEEWFPWRMDGVYRFRLCTDSVFGAPPMTQFQGDAVAIRWKDEPEYLSLFAQIAHSPGRFCLGPQPDPIDQPLSDLFMDDAVSSLLAGFCMIHEPRSLLAHGLYDRVPYAGTIVRRPRILPPQLLESITLHPRGVSQKQSKNGLDLSTERLAYFKLQDCLDLSAIVCQFDSKRPLTSSTTLSMHNYLKNIPPPGEGHFALSVWAVGDGNRGNRTSQIVSMEFDTDLEDVVPGFAAREREDAARAQGGDVEAARPRRRGAAPPGNLRGGARFFHLLWVLGAQLGLAVNDSPENASTVFVDRRLLVACQWICISLMAVPHLLTLSGRWLRWIPARPIDYELEGSYGTRKCILTVSFLVTHHFVCASFPFLGLPFEATNEMRFLTERECGIVALVLFFSWLALGRWNERHTSRDFFRIMLDHVTPIRMRDRNISFLALVRTKLWFWLQRRWDSVCPMFVQRRVFSPHWNRRSRDELLQHISFWRSINLPEQHSTVDMSVGRVFEDSLRNQGIDVGADSPARNLTVGIVVALASFCSSSPHFWLNFFTVFSCSISLGMSVSLNSMEKGASGVTIVSNNPTTTTGSLFTTLSLATVIILAFLVGQLVGSSGGIMFLAEFIVTFISLLLGGAGTISANAMESWGCFFCLSTTAFWGYLFGRVALIDGIRHKRGGYASILLTSSIACLSVFWALVFVVSRWESPFDLVINQVSDEARHWDRKQRGKKLQ